MKIYLGTDHAGYELKEKIKAYLSDLGYTVEDNGAHSFDSNDDYPDFIQPVAQTVANEEGSFGIIFGKTGEGEAMCANRTKGVRAAVYYGGNLEIVKFARQHNNANILSLGAGFILDGEAMQAVQTFIETPFSNEERHIRRLSKF
jgi:ribose 5-phosphate isomerase B